jgi:hypothetical protein
MSDWRQQLQSPTFWILAIISGLAFSVAANYLTRMIDRGFLHGISFIRKYGARRRQEEEEIISDLVQQPERLLAHGHFATAIRDFGIFSVVISLWILVAIDRLATERPVRVLGHIGGGICFVIGYLAFRSGSKAFRQINQAHNMRMRAKPEDPGPPSEPAP